MEIVKKEEYTEFVEWMAIPPALRTFKNQRSLASHLGLHESTLSDWKKLDVFWKEVEQRRLFWGKSKTNEVIYAFYKEILENPTVSNVRLWLQYFEDFQQKKTTNKVVIVDNETREQTLKEGIYSERLSMLQLIINVNTLLFMTLVVLLETQSMQ